MIELQQIPHQFASLDEALNILEQLKEMKPKIIRQTIGKKVVKKFLTDKKMSHNLQAPVTGGAPIAHDGLPIVGI